MIEVQTAAGVTTLTLNRPDKANALTGEMLETLDQAVADARSAALVLTGLGRVFSAGADLEAARAGLATDGVWERLSGRIAAYPGLTIAKLNGTVAGGACGMVLACDFRIAVTGTKLFYPVMQLGFLPQPSDPKRLADLVGVARAKQILLASERIAAQTALDWGLFDRVVAPEELDAAVGAWTDVATAADPKVCAGIKGLL